MLPHYITLVGLKCYTSAWRKYALIRKQRKLSAGVNLLIQDKANETLKTGALLTFPSYSYKQTATIT